MKNHGKLAGIPYDFRRPTFARLKERIWNEQDPRIFTPRVFGIGWAINLPGIRKKSIVGFYAAIIFYLVILTGMARSLYRGIQRLKGLPNRS
jgi:hypothetical protein